MYSGHGGARPVETDPKPSVSAPRALPAKDVPRLKEALGGHLSEDLPAPLNDDLEKWKSRAWRNGDRDEWLREAEDFVNPVIRHFWNGKRIHDAQGQQKHVGPRTSTRVSPARRRPR